MHTRTQHSCSRGGGGSVSTPYRRTMVRRRRCRVTNWDWSRLTRFFSLSRGGASAAKTGLTRRRRQTSILFFRSIVTPLCCIASFPLCIVGEGGENQLFKPPPPATSPSFLCERVCVYCRHRSTPSLVSSSVSPPRMCHTVCSADE